MVCCRSNFLFQQEYLNIFIATFISVSKVDAQEYSRVITQITQTNTSKVIQIRGLPWSVDKSYIANLFPGV